MVEPFSDLCEQTPCGASARGSGLSLSQAASFLTLLLLLDGHMLSPPSPPSPMSGLLRLVSEYLDQHQDELVQVGGRATLTCPCGSL